MSLTRRQFTARILSGAALATLLPQIAKAPPGGVIQQSATSGGPPPALPFVQELSSWQGQYLQNGGTMPTPTNVPQSDMVAVMSALSSSPLNGQTILPQPGSNPTAADLQAVANWAAANEPAGYGQPVPIAQPQLDLVVLIIVMVIVVIVAGVIIYVLHRLAQLIPG